MERAYVDRWNIEGDVVNLTYSDNDTIRVSKDDFDRAFAVIVGASKEDVLRDFAV